MKKKFKGFSLAELLISLLIISIVLSAAIPAVTKKAGQQREIIWRWTDQNNIAFTAVGSNQGVILGLDSLPMENSDLTSFMIDKEAESSSGGGDEDGDSGSSETGGGSSSLVDRDNVGKINLEDVKFSNHGDKISILKRRIDAESTNFINSHISFFSMGASSAETDAEYGGRLAMDAGNIALGIGTLQSLKNGKGYENTAIGHFALLRDTEGFRNTAIGKKTLSYNDKGAYNTAVGFASLFFLGKTESGNSSETETSSSDGSDENYENTALGAEATYSLKSGNYNTSVGSQSLRYLLEGNSNTILGQAAMYGATAADNNTVIGQAALTSFKSGNSNVAIGSNACGYLEKGTRNICIGTDAGKSVGLAEEQYGLFIGGDGTNLPLITGHTQKWSKNAGEESTETYDQELIVNARKVKFQPYNGLRPVIEFDTLAGEDGYGEKGAFLTGEAKFNLRDTWSNENPGSISMSLKGNYNEPAGKILLLDVQDRYSDYDDIDRWSDIFINNQLLIDFPKSDDKYKQVNIGLYNSLDYTQESEGGNTKKDYNGGTLALNDMIFLNHETSQDINQYKKMPKLTINSTEGFEVKNGDRSVFFQLKSGSGSGANIIFDENNFLQFGYQLQSDSSNENVGFVYKSNAENPFVIETASKESRIYLDEIAWIDKNAIIFKSLEDYDPKGKGGNLGVIIDDLYDKIEKLKNSIPAQTPEGGGGGTYSDIRKKNIIGDNTAGLKEINQIEVKDYTYKEDKEKVHHVGVIAQQLQKIFPNAVTKDKDGYLLIRKEDIFYALVNSVKELYHQFQDLTAKITGLEKRLNELEKENKQLKEQNALFEKRFATLENKQKDLEKKQTALTAK